MTAEERILKSAAEGVSIHKPKCTAAGQRKLDQTAQDFAGGPITLGRELVDHGRSLCVQP